MHTINHKVGVPLNANVYFSTWTNQFIIPFAISINQ